jgi:hypothetical protein
MRFALQVYLENGRAEEDRAAVEAAHQLMQDVWAHTMALFPDGVKVRGRAAARGAPSAALLVSSG